MSLDRSLLKKLEELKNYNIIVIGDVMVDHYMIGKSNRISPEAPVPVVEVHKEEHKLGGAANVAVNIKNLGANVCLFGIVGDDKNGAILRKKLNQAQIENNNVLLIKKRPTTVKTRIISNQKQLARVDNEVKTPITNKQAKDILERFKLKLTEEKISLIVLQDYNKGLLNRFLISEIIEIAQKNNIQVIVDPKKFNFLEYKNCTLFKPNLKEVQDAINMQINPTNINHLDKAAKVLFDELNCEIVVITLSENGIYFKKRGEESKIVKQKQIEVADVSGAGDTVIASLACAMAIALNLKEAIEFANIAALKVCQLAMVEPVSIAMLKDN